MKLIKTTLLTLSVFILISCFNDKSNLDYVPVDSPKSFKVLGFCTPAPENALNSKYAIINKTIAEVNFDYANNNYYYRASKKLNDLFKLNNINISNKENISDDINAIIEKLDFIIEDIESMNIIIKNNSDNKKVILWNIENINYSLLSTSAKDNNFDIEKLALTLMKNKLNTNN